MKDTGKVNIHGREYETVASRVQRFRQEHTGDYCIVTEVIDRTDKMVVVKASIFKGTAAEQLPIATGYAEESRTSSSINRTSALENAETSAIGRALANFGMAGTEYASADEVVHAIQQRSQPKPLPPQKPHTETAAALDLERPATPIQKSRITALLRGRGVSDSDMKGVLAGDYGVDTATMSAEDAAIVIEVLTP